MDKEIVKKIYEEVFLHVHHSNIDLFLCGGASNKLKKSNRDQLRKRLENDKKISVFYPEELFVELSSKKKKYDLFTLEKFLADNSDLIIIVCESPGSFTELGAFVSNLNTLNKLVVLIQKKYKKDKSFVMLGPVRYIEKNNKKNIIYFNNNLDDMGKAVKEYLLSNYRFYRTKKHTKGCVKEINLITGQYYFIILLLYFFGKVEIIELNEVIKFIYKEKDFDLSQLEVLYTAVLKRLYKEGLLIKSFVDGLNCYQLSKKGYYFAKDLLLDVMLNNRDRIVNRIRLDIISAQYR